MDTINVTCKEIQTADGFEYRVTSYRLNQYYSPDCEQSWYSEDGRLIADPSDPLKLIDPATSVSSDHLFTSYCVNLNHEIICDSDRFRYETVFKVWNETDSISGPTPAPESPESPQLWWLFALFVIVLLIILICFMLRKRIFRAVPSVFLCNESESRDPESAVQTQLRSDSLNQSESEQINGSVSR